MRDYIIESSKKSPFFIKGIEVKEADPLPDGVNIEGILSAIEKNFPSHYFDKLEAIIISHLDEFDERGTNAVYRDNKFYISNRLKDTNDLLDDIVHEFAHHMETLFPEMLYSDLALIREFVRKRHELNFELRSEGYWTDDYDFENLSVYLYRVGPDTEKAKKQSSQKQPETKRLTEYTIRLTQGVNGIPPVEVMLKDQKKN